MARKPSKVLPAPLPRDWRRLFSWTIGLMLAKVPPEEYEHVASEFEFAAKTSISDDWHGSWKAWCRTELIVRSKAKSVPLFSD